MLDSKRFKEIKINVPWGHISGKAWGEELNPTVIMLHGLMDNAATYNNLIPYLPDHYHYASIDLPGHGFSSHLPPHLPLEMIHYLVSLRLILAHFKQEKYIIIGHSFGARIALLFTEVYPEMIQKLILLDAYTVFPIFAEEFLPYLRFRIENHLERNIGSSPPAHSYEKIITKIMNGRLDMQLTKALTRKGAEALAERSVIPDGKESGKYVFTLDRRLKNYMEPAMDLNYVIKVLRSAKVQCPILLILMPKSVHERYQERLNPIRDEISKMKNVKIKYLEGYHDEHNENPENIAPYVVEFLNETQAKY